MTDTIESCLQDLIGLPSWGVERVHGSILAFEFGEPRLHVREPYVSASRSAEVRARAAQRRIKPVGDRNLTIFACHWRIGREAERLAEDEDANRQIQAALDSLSGEKLVQVSIDERKYETLFRFDLGGSLLTWPYERNDDEQWSVYRPNGNVLTLRADGQYSIGSEDEPPDRLTWRPLAGGVVVPGV
ncbi:MAG: hypothetical protein JO048_10580 [Methylobacteriaceae bacterium]|nr:hypothetical protein [Methylobacteriaceae bacterium]